MTNPITWTHEALGSGAIDACAAADKNHVIVHACKHPCHKKIVGYEKVIAKEHPNYLSLEKDGHLYLNLIDPPLPLFQKESFEIFFRFVDGNLYKKPLLIHCNRGESRAPSLTLLVMAKRMSLLPDSSYAEARKAFEEKFPYKPGAGITQFLDQNWNLLGR